MHIFHPGGPASVVEHLPTVLAKPTSAHAAGVEDLDAGEARAVEPGASRLNAGGERFRVFTDPAGHPFCLISWRQAAGSTAATQALFT